MPIVPVKTASTPAASSLCRPDIIARVRVRRPFVAVIATDPDAAAPAPTPKASVVAITDAAPKANQTPRDSDTPADGDAVPYKVGYGRPPKHTQFSKGRSGNPKGRPKGAKSLNTIVRETLTKKIQIRTPRGRKNTTSVQALMMQTLESALKGSQRDRHELLRYYREAVPDEPETLRREVTIADAAPDDIDAHDRAILERLRAKIIGEIGNGA